MLARSQMGGPWSRAQQIARAFLSRGHEVTLAWGDDGNCVDPVAPTFEIPVPSPLGLPEAIARHTFPLASRLGLMGRKPVHSFEEVLWLTGSLDYRYSCAAVEKLREFMRTWRPDIVYSEFNLAAVIAARAEGIPCVGSGSQPTTVAYASNPRKSAGIRRLLREMDMPAPASSLTILEGMKRRFIRALPRWNRRRGSGRSTVVFLAMCRSWMLAAPIGIVRWSTSVRAVSPRELPCEWAGSSRACLAAMCTSQVCPKRSTPQLAARCIARLASTLPSSSLAPASWSIMAGKTR